MSNKVKDNREEQRIEREADIRFPDTGYVMDEHQNQKNEWRRFGYIAGATKQLERNKEDAIGFAEWLSNNQFTMYNNVWTSTKIHYAPDEYNSEQVYEIYENWKTINQKV